MILLDPFGRPYTEDEKMLIASIGPVIPPMPLDLEEKRSPKWPAFLKDLLHRNPTCWGCGRKSETGHHEKPFHLHPELELDEKNILMVCVPCHFVLCHLGNWRTYSPVARDNLKAHLGWMKTAKPI